MKVIYEISVCLLFLDPQAFITCTNGIHYVGFVMMVFGISDAICSFLLGRLEKYSGRITIFTAGGLAHMTIILMLMFVWSPEHNGPHLWDRFVMAACWGFGDAVWQTQISCKYMCLEPLSRTITKPA